MQRTVNITARPGSIMHAKPLPLTAPWPDDAIAAIENAEFPGNFELDLITGVKYIVYYGSANSFVGIDADERHQSIRTVITADLAADADTPRPPGLNRVTVTLTNTNGGIPLPNATIRVDDANATTPAPTDANGQTSYFVGDSTHLIAANVRGYQIATQTVTATADTDVELSLAPTAIIQTVAPNRTLATMQAVDGRGRPAANTIITLALVSVQDDTGEAYSRAPFRVKADAMGLITVELIRNATYTISTRGGASRTIDIPDADTYQLPTVYA